MPVVTKLSYRPPARLVSEQKNEPKPRPISTIGFGRDSSLQSFSQGQIK